MAGKLSFSIAINLLIENFKRGTNQVKSAFRSMQAQILTFAAALGAGGIGLSNMITRFIEVARETNRVTTALKNVSGSMSQYADNQRYLLDLAKKYGLEINALTGNYAKFTASASISGMAMEEQRKIFESVSRACTAFGMSADDSNGVFLALSQMMSKGKISSEELRLQMGERLPIALQAMAKAAGVSVAGLDKLMKQGKLMSTDVLPKFAEALNEMIPNVDTDNLETSVNRLKNTFTEVVNSTGIQGTYKSLIDWLAGAIKNAADNLKNIITLAFAAIVFVAAKAATKVWQGWSLAYDNVAASGERASLQAIRATERRVAVEGTLAVKKKVELAALANYESALAGGTAQEVLAAEVAKDKAVRSRIAAEGALEKARAVEQKALDKEKEISATTSAMAGANWFKKAGIIIGAQAKKLMITLKGMWNTFAPAIIISAIVGLIGYFKDMYDEAKRIKNIFSEYKKELSSVSNTAEIAQLRVLQKLYNEATGNKKLQEQYHKRIEGVVGEQIKKEQNINDLIKKRIGLLEATATADLYTQKKVEAQSKIDELAPKANLNGISQGNFDYLMQNMAQYNNTGNKKALQKAIDTYSEHIRRTGKDFADDYQDTLVEISGYWQIARHASLKMEDSMNKIVNGSIPPVADPDDDKKKKKTPLQKQQESYNKQFEELGAELEIGKITQAEYNKSLGELNIKMYAQARGTNDKEVLESEYLKQRKIAAEKAIVDQDKNAAMVELEKIQKDYNDKVKEVRQQYDKHLIDQKELDKNLVSFSVEASKSAAGIKGIGDSADGFITAMLFNAKFYASPIKVKPRDATFDYKKSEADIESENLDKAKELAEAYKQQAAELGRNLSDELANAMANVPSLESKLKIAQVRQDIKDMSKEMGNMEWDIAKDVVSNIDGIASAFQRLKDAFDPESEATEWEKLMAVWNTFSSVVDGIMSVVETIEAITKLTYRLVEAKKTEAAIDTATTATKVTNATIGATATITAAAAEKTAATTEVAANTAKGASSAGASAAKLPFPWNIVAIGGAIAAALTAFAVIPKFAGGGIITSGPTSGDKILARVNAGEMILNGGQQSNLFDAINSGRLGGGSSSIIVAGEAKLRGDTAFLQMSNYMKRTGKRLPK